MAYSALGKNGDTKTPPETRGDYVKILVLGDKNCGKSTFIKAFAERQGNKSGDHEPTEYTSMYQCRYEIETESGSELIDVRIFEIPDVPVDQSNHITMERYDANGFIFMYAIDDPSGFEMMLEKWLNLEELNKFWDNQSAILVGNKKDLRENPQVIQRLALCNQAPVTEEQGKNFAAVEFERISKFCECSSLDENDQNIHDAFHKILSEGLLHRKTDFGFL